MIEMEDLWIWNVLIKANRNNIDIKNINYEMTGKAHRLHSEKQSIIDEISPFLELNQSVINYVDIEKDIGKPIKVNPLYRFSSIFKELMDIDNLDNENVEEIIDVLSNIILHFLGELDLRNGMFFNEYCNVYIRKKIVNGDFGEKAAENIKFFTIDEKRVISDNLLKCYSGCNCFAALKNVMDDIFYDFIIYEFLETKDSLVIYIAAKENEENICKFNLIKELFVPVGINTIVFWEHHFGVTGLESASKIGQTKIF